MTARWAKAGTVALSASIAIASAQADTVDIYPSKDNTLYEDPQGQTSNGRGENFFVGRTSMGFIRRGLVAFDIAGSIPAVSMIQRVVLTLHVSRAVGPEVEIDIHSALRDWGEGDSVADGMGGAGAPAAPMDATWLHTFYDAQFWTSAGGNFSSTVTANAAVARVGFYSFDSMFDSGLIDDVQRWLDHPETNYGWGLLVSDEFFSMSAKRFDSRENANPAFRPLLRVNYQTPCLKSVDGQNP